MAKLNRVKAIDSESDNNFRQWDNLITYIREGKIVPIIGSDFIVDDEDYPDVHNDMKIIISELSGFYGKDDIEYDSLSELYFDLKDDDRKEIYNKLGKFFEDEELVLKPSSLLLELLQILKRCNCPFVLTTSISPVMEIAMREVFGDVNVMTFNNNPNTRHLSDISCKEDLLHPTIYYMFGKVNRSEKTYVLTDTDMLAFCRSWLDGGKRPQTLSSILKNKYPLFLGNNYSDWLCRFVWLSIKESFDSNPGMLVNTQVENSLLKFLKRIDAFTQKDISVVINRINSLLDAREAIQDDPYFSSVKINTDVFISYSRSDKVIAENLYEALVREGLSVWYDRLSLGVGDRFMAEIRHGIRTTKVFVPIITHKLNEEKNDAHVYRLEWETAINRSKEFGRTFMYPISEDGFDFYNGTLPEEMISHNAAIFDSSSPDFTSFAKTLKIAIDKLKQDNK